jgi:aspartate carbamoyltransferase catalytic subunit
MNNIQRKKVSLYIKALATVSDVDASVLNAGEGHYTPPIKKALNSVGVETDPESLDDETAQMIKSSVRTAQAIFSNGDLPINSPQKFLSAYVLNSLESMTM